MLYNFVYYHRTICSKHFNKYNYVPFLLLIYYNSELLSTFILVNNKQPKYDYISQGRLHTTLKTNPTSSKRFNMLILRWFPYNE